MVITKDALTLLAPGLAAIGADADFRFDPLKYAELSVIPGANLSTYVLPDGHALDSAWIAIGGAEFKARRSRLATAEEMHAKGYLSVDDVQAVLDRTIPRGAVGQ
jgi:hypothetical protein